MSRFRPRYQDDSDFTTNAESYYKDLGRKAKLIELLAKKIYDYEETLELSLENIQNELDNYVEIIDGKISLIDNKIGEGFNQEINTLLVDWLADGTLDHIINETIFSWKVDQTEFDESMDKVNQQLEQTHKEAISTVVHDVDNKTIVSFVDDDGYKEVMDYLKPVFDETGVPCTVAIVTSYIDSLPGRLNSQDLEELHNSGWSIVSHTHNEARLDTLSKEAQEYEIKTARDILNNMGYDGDILVYPYGAQDEVTRQATRKYSSLGVGGYNQYNIMPINTYRLFRFTDISVNEFDLEACKSIVDNAPAGSWIVFYTHVNNSMWSQATTRQKLKDLILYIQSNNIDIVTLKEGLETKGNIVDAGDYLGTHFKMGRNGVLGGNGLHFVEGQLNAHPAYAARNYYPDKTITSFPFNSNNNSGLPYYAGILTTIRLGGNRWDRQICYSIDGIETASRYATEDGSWSDWGGVVTDLYDGSNVIEDFPHGITTSITRFSDGDELPKLPNGSNSAGILTTYNLLDKNSTTSPRWAYQEYRMGSTNQVWVRHITDSVTPQWSEWEQLNDEGSLIINSTLNSYSSSTPITSFPRDKVTMFYVNSGGGTGFPSNSAGVVEVIKVGDQNGYYKQIFRKYQSNEVWSRGVDIEGDWTAWEKISAV